MKQSIFILIMLFIISCSSNPRYLPKQYNIINQKEFSKNYDNVWRAISDLIANWGISPDNIDKQSGLIVISGVLDHNYKSYCDCGSEGDGFGWYQKIDYPYWRTTISVSKVNENTTKVKINTFFQSILNVYTYDFNLKRYYKSDNWQINCNSVGYLENQFLNYIEVFNQ